MFAGRARILPFLFLLALFLPSTLPADTPSDVHKPGKKTIAALQQQVPPLLKEAAIPGLSMALIRDGKTYWLGTFGVKDAKTGAPVADQTIFEAASLSKPVFAYGVLKLVDQRKLDLDTPLSQYLPKPYIAGDPRLDKITARYVLSHRTGFPNWRSGDALTICFTPGERFSYSGEGFVYLQKVVEQITGKPLNDYMTEAVFVPLHMTSSSYVWRPDFDARTATPHDGAGQPRDKWKPNEPTAAATLQTTAGDYALFVEALLNGTGLKPETVREMEKPQVAVDPECTNCTDRAPKELSKSIFWGLGIGIQETPQGESLWHWGDNGRFKAYVVAYPKQKTGVVLFMNGENGLSILAPLLQTCVGGEQPALHWLKYDSYDSPAMQFAKMAREKGAAEAINAFQPALMRGDISEDSINNVGYQLLSLNKRAEAIRIFQLNVKLHPQSWNVYDSLAEAFAKNGDKALAIQNYSKSLDLNPKNTNATQMLKKLQSN
ncbi:MAG TPA: serine hydrolase [Candidatus Sulfotelmatobacter sp.]|nr:serine hydrolase [Candidatus Sulfotelmatobacter sp.]